MITFDNLSVDNLMCVMDHICHEDIFNFRVVSKKAYRAVEKYFKLCLSLEYPYKKIESNKSYSEQYFSCRPLHQWIQASKNNGLEIKEINYNFLQADLKNCHYIDNKFCISYYEETDDIKQPKVLILDQENGETCLITQGWIVGDKLIKIETSDEISLIDLKSKQTILRMHTDNFESINFSRHLHNMLFLKDTLILEHDDYSITKLNAKNENSFVELTKGEKNKIAIKGNSTQAVTKGINNYDDNIVIVSRLEMETYFEVLNVKESAYEKFYLSKNEPTLSLNTDYILFPSLNKKNNLSYLSLCEDKIYYNQVKLGKKSEMLLTLQLDYITSSISAFYESDKLLVVGDNKNIFLINKNDGRVFHRIDFSERVHKVFANERYLVAIGDHMMNIWTIVPANSDAESHNLGQRTRDQNMLWRYLPHPFSSLINTSLILNRFFS